MFKGMKLYKINVLEICCITLPIVNNTIYALKFSYEDKFHVKFTRFNKNKTKVS